MSTEWKETDLQEFLADYFRQSGDKPVRLAERAGVGHATVYNALNKGTIPEPPQIRKLAAAMGVSRGTLFLKAGYIDEEDMKGPVIDCFDVERAMEICRSIPDVAHLGRQGWLRDGAELAAFHQQKDQ